MPSDSQCPARSGLDPVPGRSGPAGCGGPVYGKGSFISIQASALRFPARNSRYLEPDASYRWILTMDLVLERDELSSCHQHIDPLARTPGRGIRREAVRTG